jgi:hypothetical protein
MRRRHWILALVCVLVVAIGAVVVAVWRSIPDYRIAFVVDTSATEASSAVSGAVAAAVQNTGDGDALSLRRFGGRCGDPRNTAQVVGAGAGHAARISRSVRGLATGGSATLESGVLAAIKDFSGRYPFRGRKSNRIIVVTGRGTDACTHDQATAKQTLQEKVQAAGLHLDFRFVGYLTPVGEQANLTQLASAVNAPAPDFAHTPNDLAAILKHLIIPRPLEAQPLKTPMLLAADVRPCATSNTADEGPAGPVPASVRLPAVVRRPRDSSVYGASLPRREGEAPYYVVGPVRGPCKANYSADGHETFIVGNRGEGIVYDVPGGAVVSSILGCEFFPGIARYINRIEPTNDYCESAHPPDGQTTSEILAGSDGLYVSFVQDPSGRTMRPTGKSGGPSVELVVDYLGKRGLEGAEVVYCTLPSTLAKTCAAELQYFLAQYISRLNASVSVSSNVYTGIGALVEQAMR